MNFRQPEAKLSNDINFILGGIENEKTIRLVALLLVVCMTGMFLMACMPSSIDAAKDKMTKAGYSVEDSDNLLTDNEVGGITAYKGPFTSRVYITAYLYESAEDANDAANKAITEWTVDGKWIYKGDAEAIEAFTK